MGYPRFLGLLAFPLAFAGLLPGQALYHKPIKVIGDPNFIGTASSPLLVDGIGPNVVEGRELNLPTGVAVDNSVSPPNIYIADSGNHRVLGFRYATTLKAGSLADVVIGQTDRFGNQAQGGANRSGGLNSPSGLAVDSSGNLYVADTGNNRMLRYPSPLSQPNGAATPNMVIGQTSLRGNRRMREALGATSLGSRTGSNFRAGIALDSAGNLWVADSANNRVLRFPASALKAGQNNPGADLVLGQPDFVTRTAGSVRNSKTTLTAPQGIGFDASGRLLVTDAASRVVVYPAGISSSAVALRIWDIDIRPRFHFTPPKSPSPRRSRPSERRPASRGGYGEQQTSHVPVVDNFPAESTTQISPSATAVLGQASYALNKPNQGNGDSSASSFSAPVDIAASPTEFFVVDAQNNRVLVFPNMAGSIGSSATRVIGQLDFPLNAANLIEGREFGLGLTSSSSVTGTVVLDQSVNPPHLYVADTQNNRVLGFSDFTHLQNGQKADLVIGQPDFVRGLINYPSNDGSILNAAGLHAPSGLAVDPAGNLYVSDTGNSRVLRFPAPFASGKTALESADLVIGQGDFQSNVTDPAAQSLSVPIGIALTSDGGYLIVADAGHNRVLLFPKPFSNGMAASRVLGQSNFTNSVGTSDRSVSPSRAGLRSTRRIASLLRIRAIAASRFSTAPALSTISIRRRSA